MGECNENEDNAGNCGKWFHDSLPSFVPKKQLLLIGGIRKLYKKLCMQSSSYLLREMEGPGTPRSGDHLQDSCLPDFLLDTALLSSNDHAQYE